MAKLDISKLTPAERNELMQQLKQARNPMADPEYRKKCLEMRAKLEKICRKKGLTLAHVFTVSDKLPVTYKNDTTGQIWCGRGKPPDWFKAMSEKEREVSRVKDNGAQQRTLA